MKKVILFSIALLAAIYMNAQTVNVHFKNGQTVQYNSSEVDFVDFSEKGSEPIDPTPVNPPTEETMDKHITRVEFLEESDGVERLSYECIISYDSEGRVSSFLWKYSDSDYCQYKYTYDESRIIEDSGSGTTTFSLANGRITSADGYIFSYNSSDQLQAKSGKEKIIYSWNGNNLASYQYVKSVTKTVDFEYSDIRVPVNYIPYLFYLGRKFKFKENYPFLNYYGFFGKKSQNLAKKMVETYTETQGYIYPDSVTEEYGYTMKDGLPIEIAVKKTTISSNGGKSTKNNRIIIEWN